MKTYGVCLVRSKTHIVVFLLNRVEESVWSTYEIFMFTPKATPNETLLSLPLGVWWITYR